MGNRINRMLEKQIISERSLIAVQELITFLKQNVRRRDVFHAAGHDARVHQITTELERGGPGLRNYLDQGWVIESAAALQFFLMRLRKPLIPHHIQALALDENPGVAPEVVAQDVLGLLRQDVVGRHAALITAVLDLMHCILKHSPTDELTGCNIPVTMLPIFFNMQAEHILHWRRVAMVFVELIRLAPAQLNIAVDDDRNGHGLRIIENMAGEVEKICALQLTSHNPPVSPLLTVDLHENEQMDQEMLQRRMLEVNVVLRHYLLRPHHRGRNALGFKVVRPMFRQYPSIPIY